MECCYSATLEGFPPWPAFKVTQHLNGIQVMNETLKFLKPFTGGIVGMFSHNTLQTEVTSRWSDIVLQDVLVDDRIPTSIYHRKSSRSWVTKTASDHHITTTIFYCMIFFFFLWFFWVFLRSRPTTNAGWTKTTLKLFIQFTFYCVVLLCLDVLSANMDQFSNFVVLLY